MARARIGAPIVRLSGWMFPPPTALGWTAVVAVWWGVAAAIAWFLARRRRAN